ncbi:hypothetical protein MPB2EB_0110 [Mycoavidus sp. B2-EB]|nr:hypothetical protein MPB2EB_0110 [Mycoavidus sp. B2-EB]
MTAVAKVIFVREPQNLQCGFRQNLQQTLSALHRVCEALTKTGLRQLVRVMTIGKLNPLKKF